MNPRNSYYYRLFLSFVTLVAIVVSFTFPETIFSMDWVLQGAWLVALVTFPFIHVKPAGLFGILFSRVFTWGVWRMFYFDTITSNDVPGGFYLFGAVEIGIIGVVLYGVRYVIVKRYQNHIAGKSSGQEKSSSNQPDD